MEAQLGAAGDMGIPQRWFCGWGCGEAGLPQARLSRSRCKGVLCQAVCVILVAAQGHGDAALDSCQGSENRRAACCTCRGLLARVYVALQDPSHMRACRVGVTDDHWRRRVRVGLPEVKHEVRN